MWSIEARSKSIKSGNSSVVNGDHQKGESHEARFDPSNFARSIRMFVVWIGHTKRRAARRIRLCQRDQLFRKWNPVPLWRRQHLLAGAIDHGHTAFGGG